MKTEARTGWEHEVEPYIPSSQFWNECSYYSFTASEIGELSRATAELHRITLLAVDRVVSDEKMFDRFHIPAALQSAVRESWERKDPSIYGRLDLCYDGTSPPKLIEYNGDTPALLNESGPTQWYWFEQRPEMFRRAEQFNFVDDYLLEAWSEIKKLMRPGEMCHFLSARTNTAQEDWYTAEYHLDAARRVGIPTYQMLIENIRRLDSQPDVIFDDKNRRITKMFKLYPSHWLQHDQIAPHMLNVSKRVGILEPMWKMLVDHKGLLPLLWEMFPGHENLLPAFWDHDASLGERFVVKPIYGCEGENITVHVNGSETKSPGTYGDNPMVYQQYCELPRFGDVHTLIGSWVINGKPAGICVREDVSSITTNQCRIAPHVFFAS